MSFITVIKVRPLESFSSSFRGDRVSRESPLDVTEELLEDFPSSRWNLIMEIYLNVIPFRTGEEGWRKSNVSFSSEIANMPKIDIIESNYR